MEVGLNDPFSAHSLAYSLEWSVLQGSVITGRADPDVLLTVITEPCSTLHSKEYARE